MEAIYVCYEVDDDSLRCVGTAETQKAIDDFAYDISRRTDYEYQVFCNIHCLEDGACEHVYMYRIWNGVVEY